MTRALASSYIATFRAPLNRSIPPCRVQRYQRRSIPFSTNLIPIEPFDNTVPVILVVLEEDFHFGGDTYWTFSLEVNDFITRKAIRRFQVNIENTLKHSDHICYYYGQFIDYLELESIFDYNVVFIAAFKTNIPYSFNLDIYGCCSGSFNLCHDCWTSISRSKEPKFDIFNKMPQLCCQYYSTFLKNLTFAEKAIIAEVHSVVTILKWRPNNSFIPKSVAITLLVNIGNNFCAQRSTDSMSRHNITTTWIIERIYEYTKTLHYKSFAMASSQWSIIWKYPN